MDHTEGLTRRGSSAFGWLLLAFLFFVSGLLHGCSTRKGDSRIALEIRHEVARPFRWFKKASVDDDDIQPLVRKFYLARRFQPAWTHDNGPTGDANELMKELAEAPDYGLRSEDYDLQRLETLKSESGVVLGGEGKPKTLAALDIELTRNFLKYATHRSSGQINPKQLPADWHVQPRKNDVVAALTAAIDGHRVHEALDSVDPEGRQYGELRNALASLRQLEAKGGWPEVPPGGALKRGSSGPRVAALQQRLAASGDLGGGYAASRFDAATEAGLRSFQERQGLEPDGVANDDDFAQLNVPIGSRIRQIGLNLERWRWVPESLFVGRYLEVNVPEYMMRVHEGGHTVLDMRVVVGKRFSPTPFFVDEISYLVINPFWNVPASIATEEILLELQKDPDYLAKNNMRLLSSPGEDASEVDPHSVNWNATSPEDFTYAIRQDPGPYNPVGHVKFMCPNQFNVYLHDTPSDQLFAASERSRSHGCIRLERPLDLAEYVLRGKPEWDRVGIEAAFDSSHNRSVTLPEPLPVRIMYWTAFVDDRGRLQFRDDVYGLDKMLDRALRAPRPGISTTVRT